MLFPQHPRPVGRRRAVAAMTVAAKQAAPITPGHVLPVADDRPGPLALVAHAPGGADEAALRFTVVYRLPEYLAILREALAARLRAAECSRGQGADDRLSLQSRLALKLLVPLVGTPVFLLKKGRMPVCRFTIDTTGIARASADGRLHVAWRDIVAVHRLASAWLVDKGDGGLPIPHRCLDAVQKGAFERLLVSHFPQHTPI
jgi:hypothetical protein